MKRLMIIDSDEFVKYQQGISCSINAILPITEQLDYMKIIMKTYIDVKKWRYHIVIGDDDRTPVTSNLDEDWFRDCEHYVKCNLKINNLKIQS